MTWFFAVLVVLLMGAVAVVAAGRGGPMAEVYDDRRDVRVQAERPLDGDDLRRVRFTTALRGYRMSEVDALLERLAAELDEARRHEARREEARREEARREEARRETGRGETRGDGEAGVEAHRRPEGGR